MIIYSNGWLQPKVNSKWHYFGENGMSFCGKLRTKKTTGFAPGVMTKENACVSCWNKKAEVDKKIAQSLTGMIEPMYHLNAASGNNMIDGQYPYKTASITSRIASLVCRHITEYRKRPEYLILGAESLKELTSMPDVHLYQSSGWRITKFDGMKMCVLVEQNKDSNPNFVDVA
jgi:hypothetical protein